jgi:hypothetical protein
MESALLQCDIVYVCIDGDTSLEQRIKAIEQSQTDRILNLCC